MPKKIYHLTIEHLYYLLQNNCFLSFKADGIFKTKIINNSNLEYELLEDGRELVFDYVNDSNINLNVQERINQYCKLINFDKPEFEELTINNFEDVIQNYITFYSEVTVNIIPKIYLKINNQDKLKIIQKLNQYFPQINYPTDGWIISPTDTYFSAKIKPLNQMTIDLKFKKGTFYDNNNNMYTVEGNNLEYGIYRCYYKNNNWIAREKRHDKKYANPKNIVDLIQNQINFKLNLNNIDEKIMFNNYYLNDMNYDKYVGFFNHIKKYTINYLQECENKKVLDVGCGKSSSILMWKEIKPNSILGLDIDPICIFKSTVISNSNNYIWFNFNESWNIINQIKYFGKIWESSQIFKINKLFDKFDYIVFNFSIHYCTNYSKLIQNIIKTCKPGTKLKFSWIDYKNINIFDIKIKNNNVNLKLPWKKEIHSEPYFNYKEFSDNLKSYNWKFKKQEKIDTYYELYQNWQKNIYFDTWYY